MSLNEFNLFGYKKYFSFFIDLYEKNLLPNKILLNGHSGLGKSIFAYHFINYIFSKNEDLPYDLSNHSINPDNKSFKLINENIHPNFYLIDIEEGKQNIDIAQIRNMSEYIKKTAFDKKFKFVLINNSEYLNINSINSLLRITEEPKTNTFFFLIHDSSKFLTKTLKSRFIEFKIHFPFIERKEILNNILSQQNITLKEILLSNLFSYYETPGHIINFLNDFNIINQDLTENINIESLLLNFLDKKNNLINFTNKKLFTSLLELSLYKKIFKSKNKNKIYNAYSSMLKSINEKDKFNLDKNNFNFEIKHKYINAN